MNLAVSAIIFNGFLVMGFNAFLEAASRPTVDEGVFFVALFWLVVVSILGPELVPWSLTSRLRAKLLLVSRTTSYHPARLAFHLYSNLCLHYCDSGGGGPL